MLYNCPFGRGHFPFEAQKETCFQSGDDEDDDQEANLLPKASNKMDLLVFWGQGKDNRFPLSQGNAAASQLFDRQTDNGRVIKYVLLLNGDEDPMPEWKEYMGKEEVLSRINESYPVLVFPTEAFPNTTYQHCFRSSDY